jgi:hypothetical protein
MLKHPINTIKTRKSRTRRTNSVKIIYLAKPYIYTNIFKDLYDLVADYLLSLKRSMLSGPSSCAGNSRRSLDLQGDHEDPDSRRAFSVSLGGFTKQCKFSPDGSLRIFIQRFYLGVVVKTELSFTFHEKYRISWVDEWLNSLLRRMLLHAVSS